MQVILLLFRVLKILRLVVLPPGKLNMSLWLSLLKMYWNQLPLLPLIQWAELTVQNYTVCLFLHVILCLPVATVP